MNETFEICEPFDIDHGELDGLRLQDAFTLGVEWQMVYEQLENGRLFERTIHSENINRLKAMCQRRGRDFTIEPLIASGFDDWARLRVEAM